MTGFMDGGFGALGSVVNGIFGLFGARQQNKAQMQQLKYQYDRNTEMMREQNAWNEQMWDKTNQYNSPIEQRKRMEAAGLNPMFYGLDGSSAGGLQSASFSAPSGMPVQNELGVLGQGIGDAAMQQAQIELIKAQAKKTDSERELTDIEKDVQSKLAVGRVETQHLIIEGLGKDLDIKDETIKNLAKSTEELDNRINATNRDLDIKEFDAVTKRFIAEVDAICKQRGLDLEETRIANEYALGLRTIELGMMNYNLAEERYNKEMPFILDEYEGRLRLQVKEGLRLSAETIGIIGSAAKAFRDAECGSTPVLCDIIALMSRSKNGSYDNQTVIRNGNLNNSTPESYSSRREHWTDYHYKGK